MSKWNAEETITSRVYTASVGDMFMDFSITLLVRTQYKFLKSFASVYGNEISNMDDDKHTIHNFT